MKEYFLQTTNERGMFLPFVLFIILILFSVITTMTLIYKNETKISHQLWEQMKAETIVQMSKAKFKAERIYEENEAGTQIYHFPVGEVLIIYSKSSDRMYDLILEVTTDGDEQFIMNALLVV